MQFLIKCLNAELVICKVFLLSILLNMGCDHSSQAYREVYQTNQISGLSANLIQWPVVQYEDTILLVGLLEFQDIAMISASELHNTRPRGFIAADSLGIVISGIWTENGVETRAYDWNANQQWVDIDTLCVSGMPPTLGACAIAKDNVFISGVSHRIRVLDRTIGAPIAELTFPGQQKLDNGAPFLFATSIAAGNSLCILGWFSWIPGLSGICATVYDEDAKELFTVGANPADYTGKLCECRVTCSDSTFFFASVAEDRIFHFSKEGELSDCFTCGHIPQRELECPSARGEPVLFPVIGSLHFASPDNLWILHGPGGFATDSSEIWLVDLSRMEGYRLALTGMAIGFGVWEHNLAIVFRGEDEDLESMEWNSSKNYIQIGRWNYADE